MKRRISITYLYKEEKRCLGTVCDSVPTTGRAKNILRRAGLDRRRKLEIISIEDMGEYHPIPKI